MEIDTKKKLATARQVFDAYWKRIRPHPVLLGLIIAGGLSLQAAFLVAPLYLRNFFNILATQNSDAASMKALYFTLSMVVGMWLIEWASRRTQDMANVYLASRVMSRLMTDSFEYLMGHSHNFFVSNFAGSLTHKVNKFARSFELLFDTIIISFLPTFIFLFGAIVVLYLRNHVLGTALAIWSVGFVSFQFYVALLRQPVRAARSAADTRITGGLADAISNQSTITLFSGNKFEQGIFAGIVEVWRKATMRSWHADSWIWAGVGLFMITIEAGMLYGGIHFWRLGLLTIGDFVLIQTYLMTIFDRLAGINHELRRFFDSYSDAAEMVAILETQYEIRDKRGAKNIKVQDGAVWFDDVGFYFNDGTTVLENFNLNIAGGEKIAFVGPSGAGKTTVTKLLLRLYDVKNGSIKIDGQNISDVTQESLRDAISFVPQEPILFHRTLMENIRYGRRDATDEEVFVAAKQAHCHKFIEASPLGYATFVGERGVKLSGGERQRVAIARALLKNAPILVLDEATSSLDSESESLIQDALETLMKEKTVVVIAHRLSTVMKMDRIVVIDGGGIVAQGTHLELINQEGLYRKLWSIQAGGFLGDGHKSSPNSEEEMTEEIEEEIEEEIYELAKKKKLQ